MLLVCNGYVFIGEQKFAVSHRMSSHLRKEQTQGACKIYPLHSGCGQAQRNFMDICTLPPRQSLALFYARTVKWLAEAAS